MRPTEPIRATESCSHSSVKMVYVAILKRKVPDRNLLYCAIPCSAPKNNYIEGEVMSLRMDGLYKGIPGRCFPNAMIIDIWYQEKKRHTKIFYTGKIQMAGMTSEAMMLNLLKIVCNILNRAEEFLYANSGMNCDSLLSKLEGEKRSMISTFSIKNDSILGSLTFCEHSIQTSIIQTERIDLSPSERDILDRCSDILNDSNAPFYALEHRISALTSSTRGVLVHQIDRFDMCSVVLKYRLGYNINRYSLVNELSQRGYNTYFANTSTQSNVSVYPEDYPNEAITFSSLGSVKHVGDDLELALLHKEDILRKMSEIEHLVRLEES